MVKHYHNLKLPLTDLTDYYLTPKEKWRKKIIKKGNGKIELSTQY